MEITINVYPLFFIDSDDILDDNKLIVEEGCTLRDVFKRLKIPIYLRTSAICLVNYEKVKMSYVLKENDVVSFVAPMAGG